MFLYMVIGGDEQQFYCRNNIYLYIIFLFGSMHVLKFQKIQVKRYFNAGYRS